MRGFSAKSTKKITAIAAAIAAACVGLLSVQGCAWLKPDTPKPASGYVKDVYSDYFTFGTAVQAGRLEKYAELLPNFNSITAEFQMKWRQLEPNEGEYFYENADTLINWAAQNGASVRGHCLVWYKSLPDWVYASGDTGETVLQRMTAHVKKTVKYFGNGVYCWDVVNEALRDSVTQRDLQQGTFYRTGWQVSDGECDWYALTGTEYIKQAFLSADEARRECGAEDVKLFYNDYSLNQPEKREACVRLIEELREDGVPIDGVGMQAHYRLPDYLADPEAFLADFEASVKTFTGLGLDVHITELDVRIFGDDEEIAPFDSLPYETERAQGRMYGEILRICRKYSAPWREGAGRVGNVTVWGISDADNSWNTAAHREYPLLFGADMQPKNAYYEITSF